MPNQPEVQIPLGATDDGKDLLAPLRSMLEELGLVPGEGRVSLLSGTPDSIAVINAGMASATKATVALIATLGGGGSLVAAVLTAMEKIPEGFRTPTVYGVAIVALATILGLAHVVGSDVRGRASATTAQLEQRGAVAIAWLETVRALTPPAEQAATTSELPDKQVVHLDLTLPAQRVEIAARRAEPADQDVAVGGRYSPNGR